MNEIAHEILSKLHGERVIEANEDTANRHRLFIKENGGVSAYHFSVPIRKEADGNGFGEFYDADGSHIMNGTNCRVIIKDTITMVSGDTKICIDVPHMHEWCRVGKDIICGNVKITPTLNGICMHCRVGLGETFAVSIATENTYEEHQYNSKYFAFMKQKFVPSFTVSPIGVKGDESFGALLLTAYKEKEAGRYHLTFTSPDTSGEMFVEFNMYEPKLIQDTTVESAHPDENNAYGVAAFVGHSDIFGAQQLYMKFNYPMLGDLGKERISNIKLYLPILGGDMPPLEALHMDNRFCSFGSVWNKRIKPSDQYLPVKYHNGFCCIDLSEAMIDRTGRLKFSNGFHLRADRDSVGYCSLATGDSHLFPSVLEVRCVENQ